MSASLRSPVAECFRQALALSHAGDETASAQLRDVNANALDQADGRIASLSAAALVLTSHTIGNFRDMPRWLDMLADTAQAVPPTDSADDELLGRTARLIGQLYFDLDDPATDGNVPRLMALLEMPGTPRIGCRKPLRPKRRVHWPTGTGCGTCDSHWPSTRSATA